MEIGDKTDSGWEVTGYDDVRRYSMKHNVILTSEFSEFWGFKKGTKVVVHTNLYTSHKYIELDGEQITIMEKEYKLI